MRRICPLIFSISIFFLLFLPNVGAQTGIYPAPILLEPPNGQKLRREAVTFIWTWEGELAEDEYFCVEVWKLQMEPTSAPLRLTRSNSLSVPVVDLSSGDYQWRVTVMRVVDRRPEEELSEPSETWNFSWDQTILMWVKKNIVVLLVCATVILALITALVLTDLIDHIRNYLNENWRDWERIIDKEIDNVVLKEIYLELPIVVKDDSLERIPKVFRKYALHRYYNEHREEDRLDYPPEKGYGYMGLRLASTDIASSWKSMMAYLDSSDDQRRSQFNTLSASFILSLTQTLPSIEIEEEDSRDYMHGYLLRMPTLRTQIPRSIPVVFLQKTVFTREDVEEIVDFVKDFGTEHSLTILITCDPPEHEGESARRLQRLINGSSHTEDFIIWQLVDILHVLRAEDRFDRFLRMIISRRSVLSHPI